MIDDAVVLQVFALIAITAGGAFLLAEMIASTVLAGLAILGFATAVFVAWVIQYA